MFSFYLWLFLQHISMERFHVSKSHRCLVACFLKTSVFLDPFNRERSQAKKHRAEHWSLLLFIYVLRNVHKEIECLKRTRRNLSVLKVLYLKRKEMQNMRNRWRGQNELLKHKSSTWRQISLLTELVVITQTSDLFSCFFFVFLFSLRSSFTNVKLIFPSHRLRL